MNITDWFKNLGPKRKFAIKSIAKLAAVSVPVIGDQLHTLFETAFDELKDHEESADLIELTQLVNQRFDQLITQVETRASSDEQIEMVITRYLQANQRAREVDLQMIDQCAVRMQESLNRLHSSIMRVEVKLDDMGLQLDSLFAEISQAEMNAVKREDHAQAERSEIKQEIYKLQRQMMVQSQGSLGDSLSIRGDQEKRLIRQLLGRYRALPQHDRENLEIGNDLSVLLTTANMYTEADEVLSETGETAETQTERGLIHFNRYMNALKANRLDEALEHYLTAVEADRSVALFPPHKFTPRKILGFGAFGVTFLCDQFGLKVAVKSISLNRALGDSEEVVNRLAQEWTTLMSLSDPRIIRARDFDPNRQHNGELRPYLTMEYFPGDNLQTYCEKNPNVFGLEALEHTLKVALEIAKGLFAAHQKQVIHRDIKPANVLYRGDESKFDVRIIDFGLALPPQNMNEQSMFMSQLSMPSQQGSLLADTIAGTLKYAPPEQLGEGGVIGPHSDVYSWGRTLNYLLFGRTDPRTREIRRLSEELQDLLDDCLESSCEKRLDGFAEGIRSLSELLDLDGNQKRREAEEQRLREAEEQRLREAEEQRLREAEAQARLEAEELRRREAEELRRREVEERRRREAEEQKRQEMEQQIRREMEEERRKQQRKQQSSSSPPKKQRRSRRDQAMLEYQRKRNAETLQRLKEKQPPQQNVRTAEPQSGGQSTEEMREYQRRRNAETLRKMRENNYGNQNTSRTYQHAQSASTSHQNATYQHRHNAEALKRLEKKKKKGGCFITSAVCQTLHLPDNCYELELLRSLRDNYMRANDYRSWIDTYYEVAPTIVREIDRCDASEAIYQEIYHQHLKCLISLVEDDHAETAVLGYRSMVEELCARFTPHLQQVFT